MNTPQSLWMFLKALPASMPAEQFYALMLSGTIGVLAHYTMKWARGDIAGNLVEYLFKQGLRNTVLSFGSYVAFSLTTITTGALDGTGWFTVLWMGLTSGFAVDSIANRGQRPVWPDDKRAALTQSIGEKS